MKKALLITIIIILILAYIGGFYIGSKNQESIDKEYKDAAFKQALLCNQYTQPIGPRQPTINDKSIDLNSSLIK